MPPALVRLAKRKTTWNGEVSPEEVVKIEFRDRATGELDLTPSFYLLADGHPRLVQAYAEHGASLMDRPENRVHVDVLGIDAPAPLHTTGETLFRFTRDEAHHEIRFRSPTELTAFVSAILADVSRRLPTSADAALEYVGARLDARDPEWVEACASNEKASKWPEQVEKLRRKAARRAATPNGGGGDGGPPRQ